VSILSEIAGEEGRVRRAGSPLRDAIVADLERLCAVRRGSMLLAPSYGVDDVTLLFHSFPESVEAWIARLEATLRDYEPRLRDVRVTRVASGALELTMRVEIQATMVGAGRTAPASFSATIDPQARLTVR
jgi:type VI secretion system protein